MKTLFEFLQTKHIQTYEAIDLGLSVKWANCNVGAKKPEDYGLLFQFGRTDGYHYDSQLGTSFKAKDGLIKIDDIPITTSGKQYNRHDTLYLADDAAHANMKGSWRMPTIDEIWELIDNTTNKWTTLNGINGYEFVSKKDKTKSIFIPAGGNFYGNHGVFKYSDCNGFMWSSTVSFGNANYAFYFCFGSGGRYIGEYRRSCGASIRGVCK